MKLRLRLPGQGVSEISLDDDCPWIQLLLAVSEKLNGISPYRLKVMGGGFPPRAIQPADELEMLCTLVRDGDMLTVQVGDASVKQGMTDGKYVPPSNDRTVFVRRTVPGDNSCLFHACAYVLKDKSRSLGPSLRQECAEVVLANPQKYDAALLGQPPRDYVDWILRPTSWGGAIELSILSFLYQTEIIALDLESATMQRFGEGENYSLRAFVVYTGKHFDAIGVANPLSASSERDDQVLFNPRDEKVFQRAVRFVQECGSKK